MTPTKLKVLPTENDDNEFLISAEKVIDDLLIIKWR